MMDQIYALMPEYVVPIEGDSRAAESNDLHSL